MKILRKSMFLVLLISISLYSQNANITILHVNDTHGRDSQDVKVNKTTPPTTNYKAGASRRAYYMNSVKNEKPNTLLLHAGDTITGSVYSTVFKGKDEVDIQNMIGFNAIAIGNHLFDYGIANAKSVVSKRKMPTLSVNIKDKKTGKYFAKPYITTVVDGVSIAIIGVTTSDSVFSGEVRDNVVIEEEIKALKDFLASTPLNTTNNVTILLSHSGVDKDQEIAKAIPNTFNLIVGGHTHTLLEKPIVVGTTTIVQAGYYGEYVGRVDIDVKNGKISPKDIKYQVVAMNESIPEDTNVKKYVEAMDKKLAKEFNVKIGSLPMDLEHAGIRSNSMALGNFASDLTLDAYPQASISFMNSGSLRTPLYEGTITLGRIQNEFFPFDNEVILATFDGVTIKEYLSISGKKRGAGAFMQLSRGMEVVYDAKTGDLLSAKLNGKDINDKEDYVVVISTFVFGGGDGYSDKNNVALGKKAKKVVMTGNDIRDALINNIKKLGDIKPSYIDSKPRVIFK